MVPLSTSAPKGSTGRLEFSHTYAVFEDTPPEPVQWCIRYIEDYWQSQVIKADKIGA